MRGQLVGRYRAWDDAIDAQREKNEIYWAQKTDRRTEEKNLVFGRGVVEERGRTMKTDAQFGFSGGGGGKRLLFNVERTEGAKRWSENFPAVIPRDAGGRYLFADD